MGQMALLPPRSLEFTVEITPIGQGSMIPTKNRTGMHHSPELLRFRTDFARVAKSKLRGAPPISKPNGVDITIVFRLRRTGTTALPVNSIEGVYDLDKLERAVGDSLQKVCFEDDSQIVHWDATKVWATGRVASVSIKIVEVPG